MAVTLTMCIGASFTFYFYPNYGFGNFCASLGCQITAIIVYLISFLTLFCAGNIRKSTPANYILLFIFTVSMGFMVAGWCAYLTPASVLMAIGCLCLVLSCIFFAVLAIPNMAKAAFAVCMGILACILLELIVTIPLLIAGAFEGLWILYCTIGVLVSAGLIYLDVFIIMLAGKYAMDEYILCALMLYIDIIRLLLYLLMIFG